MNDWEPELYNRFRRYRAEPVTHIFERLHLAGDERIADLGCGGGEHTLELARRAPHGTVRGIDGSRAMIDSALQLLALEPDSVRSRVSFELCELAQFRAHREYTVIFSNAAFHWIPDQRALFAACFEALRPGGRIVVQVPANNSETAKAELTLLAREEPWARLLGGLDQAFEDVPPEYYARMLRDIGYDSIDCYHHVFRHPVDRPAEVVDWYRATGLRPFLAALPAGRHAEFLAAYRARLERAYGTTGKMIFPFRRLFIWGRRPAAD
jgi:trans-aconitate 2-methyltransferase